MRNSIFRYVFPIFFIDCAMEGFSNDEIKEIESSEDLNNMITVLDSILDGGAFHIRITDTDRTVDVNKKPVLPKGLEIADGKLDLKLNNKRFYAYILTVLISLIIDLNPNTAENEEDYTFRIAIIINAIISGCVYENNNFVYSDITFDANYIKTNGKDMKNKHTELVNKINDKLSAASNFLAFSSMNMVRFNHHFPIEKLNLIEKSMLGLPEEQRNRIIEEDKLESFYDQFVTAARILNDKKYYEKYILKKSDENNNYFYYKVLGTYDIAYEEEIVKIRSINTPNGFLICDIVKEIISDLANKQLLFMVPYVDYLVELMKIRKHLRENPFGYHPSKFFYKCKAEDYDEIVSKFQNIMKHIGSFVYLYSEEMYSSVREAKCRKKYEKQIKQEDENLIKAFNKIAKRDVSIDEKNLDLVKSKLGKVELRVDESTDIVKLNEEIMKKFTNL